MFGSIIANQSEENPQIWVLYQIYSPISFVNVSTITYTYLSEVSEKCVWYQFKFHKSKEWVVKVSVLSRDGGQVIEKCLSLVSL